MLPVATDYLSSQINPKTYIYSFIRIPVADLLFKIAS